MRHSPPKRRNKPTLRGVETRNTIITSTTCTLQNRPNTHCRFLPLSKHSVSPLRRPVSYRSSCKQCLSHETHNTLCAQNTWLSYETHNTLCAQNTELLDVKPRGTAWVLKKGCSLPAIYLPVSATTEVPFPYSLYCPPYVIRKPAQTVTSVLQGVKLDYEIQHP
jgi:hypothetical protein